MKETEINLLINKILGENAKIVSRISGGMMNYAYLIDNGKKYIIYIPTESSNKLVNRVFEKENQKIINEIGITSKNIYFDEKLGIKINEFIEGDSLNHTNEFNYNKVAEIFKKLHNSIILAQNDYNPFERFKGYEETALSSSKIIPYEYEDLREFLFKNKSFLEKQMVTLCHNDAQRSNIIKSTNENYYFIDFEFAGNNDPVYDIATFGNDLVSEGRKLLDAYFDNNPSNDQIKRFYLWRIFISLQWYNVAVAKHYNGDGNEYGFNFLEVADKFLKNAKDAYDGYKLEVKNDMDDKEATKLIIQTLDKVRHFLQKDGGDVEFVSFKDGIVFVKMQGACQDCSFANADIKELVEVILQEEVPGVIEVRVAE